MLVTLLHALTEGRSQGKALQQAPLPSRAQMLWCHNQRTDQTMQILLIHALYGFVVGILTGDALQYR
jgi:hypothetical protein